MSKRINVFTTALMLTFALAPAVFSFQPKIVSVTMDPPNPGYGDLVNITVSVCAQKYNNAFIDLAISTYPTRQIPGTGGQVFLVYGTNTNGVTTVDSPLVNMPNSMGGSFAPSNPADVTNCADCGDAPNTPDNQSRIITQTYAVHVPTAQNFTACSIAALYLQVGVRYSNINTGDWVGIQGPPNGCSTSGYTLSWPIQTPPTSFNITKRYEGVLQTAGDLVLFSIDYNYANGKGFQIVDSIPGGGNLALVSSGPQSIPGRLCRGANVASLIRHFYLDLPRQDRGRWAGTGDGLDAFTNEHNAIGNPRIYEYSDRLHDRTAKSEQFRDLHCRTASYHHHKTAERQFGNGRVHNHILSIL